MFSYKATKRRIVRVLFVVRKCVYVLPAIGARASLAVVNVIRFISKK